MAQLRSEKVKSVDQRIVAGDPARALPATAGANPAKLIVVGNRGVGAEDGHLLGSVPGEVMQSTVCDVMIVQTSEHDTT